MTPETTSQASSKPSRSANNANIQMSSATPESMSLVNLHRRTLGIKSGQASAQMRFSCEALSFGSYDEVSSQQHLLSILDDALEIFDSAPQGLHDRVWRPSTSRRREERNEEGFPCK